MLFQDTEVLLGVMRNKQQIAREARSILNELAANHPILANLPIRVSARMTRAAGKAKFKGLERRPVEIVLSLPFFADEANDLRSTTTHEAAHVVAGHAAGHGPAWKMVHRSMGGNAQRCHKMELAQGYTARRNQPKVRVSVPCPVCKKPMMLGPTQAKKAARGLRYTHPHCTTKQFDIFRDLGL